MIAEWSREKLSLHRNQKRVVEYSSCLLSAINDAILLYTVVAMGPIPPAVENTQGEKDLCSISLTLFFSSYSVHVFYSILIWRNWHRIEQMG